MSCYLKTLENWPLVSNHFDLASETSLVGNSRDTKESGQCDCNGGGCQPCKNTAEHFTLNSGNPFDGLVLSSDDTKRQNPFNCYFTKQNYSLHENSKKLNKANSHCPYRDGFNGQGLVYNCDSVTKPTLDGTPLTRQSLGFFSHNLCSPECCPSQFNCQGGCVCLTENQKAILQNRGTNRVRLEPENMMS